jgi:IMP and pyridine-specific 5'-nucleotidase
MKKMLSHSFVLDCLETTGAETFSHFEHLIEEHRKWVTTTAEVPSPLKQLVPTIGTFHTNLPLREAFLFYDKKHGLTNRKHVQISFNEIRHILNMAQIMALRDPVDTENDNKVDSAMEVRHQKSLSNSSFTDEDNHSRASSDATGGTVFNGPKLITFDGDQTLYSDGSNFDHNPELANYLYRLLKHGVNIAVVTAAGYEYNLEKYEMRLSGLLAYFKSKGLTSEECDRFYLFGGECNYLLKVSTIYHAFPSSIVCLSGAWHSIMQWQTNMPTLLPAGFRLQVAGNP